MIEALTDRARRVEAIRKAIFGLADTVKPAVDLTGIYVDGRVIGQANQPMGTVPHPRTYDSMEGITATHLSEEEFEGLWSEAQAKLQ